MKQQWQDLNWEQTENPSETRHLRAILVEHRAMRLKNEPRVTGLGFNSHSIAYIRMYRRKKDYSHHAYRCCLYCHVPTEEFSISPIYHKAFPHHQYLKCALTHLHHHRQVYFYLISLSLLSHASRI